MNAEQLNVIKERAAKATHGPWRSAELYGVRTQNDKALSIPLRPSDATFIAHSRKDVPALVAEVERLSRGRNISSVQIRQLFGEIERLKSVIRTIEANANDEDFVKQFAKEALETDS